MLFSRLDTTAAMIEPSKMITLTSRGGARALDLGAQTGALEPHLQADLAIVSLAGAHQQPTYDPVGALIKFLFRSRRDNDCHRRNGVSFNGRVTTVDEEDLRERVKRVAQKLCN